MPTAEEFDRLATERLDASAGHDELATLFTIGLFRTATWCEADFEADVTRPAGLSWAGFRLLHVLSLLGPLPSGELARLVRTTAATVSSVVATLEKAGLVERARARTDRRQVHIRLTDEGARLIEEVARRQHARERLLVEGVAEEDLRACLRVFATMAAGARARRGAAPRHEAHRP